jgi:hypothetical protein
VSLLIPVGFYAAERFTDENRMFFLSLSLLSVLTFDLIFASISFITSLEVVMQKRLPAVIGWLSLLVVGINWLLIGINFQLNNDPVLFSIIIILQVGWIIIMVAALAQQLSIRPKA